MSERVVATNRRAYHDYFVEDKLEAGIALTGNEVKSLRAHHVSLQEAYADLRDGELWVIGMRINPYQTGPGQPTEAPDRPRKLLVRRQELQKLERQVRQKGMTLMPLKIYFSGRGLAKLEVGICRGKRQYDKRETLKERDEKLALDRTMAERKR